MAAPHVYARLEWLRSTGVKRSCAATSASLARAESGGTRLAGSMELRRPECIRSIIARRPARMLSSPRSRGPASVRHSRVVSTPPVRSVHPMDPIGSVAAELGRGCGERRSGTGLRDVGGLDVEAEHHAALVVLG